MNGDGKSVVAVNPDFVYLDTSVWIDLFQAYRTKNDRIIDRIAGAVGNPEYRLLVSTINFIELIGTSGDISMHFSPESLRALDYVRQTSLRQPPLITEQEVQRFVNRTKTEVRILDQDNFALTSIAKACKQRKIGSTLWLSDVRRQWDEENARDRVLNLDADLYELTGAIAYGSVTDRQRASGQLGDRNHAVYIPYCDYFGTSDGRLIKALETEFKAVLVEDNLHLFRVSEVS